MRQCVAGDPKTQPPWLVPPRAVNGTMKQRIRYAAKMALIEPRAVRERVGPKRCGGKRCYDTAPCCLLIDSSSGRLCRLRRARADRRCGIADSIDLGRDLVWEVESCHGGRHQDSPVAHIARHANSGCFGSRPGRVEMRLAGEASSPPWAKKLAKREIANMSCSCVREEWAGHAGHVRRVVYILRIASAEEGLVDFRVLRGPC